VHLADLHSGARALARNRYESVLFILQGQCYAPAQAPSQVAADELPQLTAQEPPPPPKRKGTNNVAHVEVPAHVLLTRLAIKLSPHVGAEIFI
jgi:hypothetical protein